LELGAFVPEELAENLNPTRAKPVYNQSPSPSNCARFFSALPDIKTDMPIPSAPIDLKWFFERLGKHGDF
jgi:hypothetical protein